MFEVHLSLRSTLRFTVRPQMQKTEKRISKKCFSRRSVWTTKLRVANSRKSWKSQTYLHYKFRWKISVPAFQYIQHKNSIFLFQQNFWPFWYSIDTHEPDSFMKFVIFSGILKERGLSFDKKIKIWFIWQPKISQSPCTLKSNLPELGLSSRITSN